MKIIHNLCFALLVLSVSSCLKDKNVEDMKYGVHGIGDLSLAYFPRNWTAGGFYPGNKDTTINILAIYIRSKDSVATEDVRVKLKRRDDMVTGNGLDLPPADKFRLGALEVLIPKGSDRGMLQLTGNPQDLLGQNYGLAFEIESTTSKNVEVDMKFDSVLTYLEMRNRFDGVYIVSGPVVDVTDDHITGEYPQRVELHSTGENSVALFNQRVYNYSTPMVTDGSLGAYGTMAPEFTFAADGKITGLVNYFGQGAGARRRWAVADPTGANMYNFSNNTIAVKFTMNEGSAANVRTSFDWVLTRVGPRP